MRLKTPQDVPEVPHSCQCVHLAVPGDEQREGVKMPVITGCAWQRHLDMVSSGPMCREAFLDPGLKLELTNNLHRQGFSVDFRKLGATELNLTSVRALGSG